MDEIVVGVDGSEGAAAALRWAAREARLSGRRVVAMLAWGLLDQHHPDPAGPFDPGYGQEHALAALDAYVIAALGSDGADVARTAVCDLAAPALLDGSKEAALLAVGSRGLGGFRRLLVGSVSERCVHHATCPVAVVRPDVAPRSGNGAERILVGIDGSDTSQLALRWALGEARLRQSSIEVVHAWHLPLLGTHPYAIPMSDPKEYEESAQRVLDTAVAREDLSGLASPVGRFLVCASPASAILTRAKGADLVVVGSRGLGGFAGLLLGSVSHQILHHASCSVVVVPPGNVDPMAASVTAPPAPDA